MMTFNMICANCGKPFDTDYDNKIYCSGICKRTAGHRRYRQTHKEQFRAYNRTPKREEYMKAYRKKYYQEHKKDYKRKCVTCGKEFETSQNRAIYCSMTCKTRTHNDKRRPTIKGYNKEYYMNNRAKLIERAKLYRETHKDIYRANQRRLYHLAKASKLRECIECGRRFRPENKMIKICSDTCRVKRRNQSIKDFYKRNPDKMDRHSAKSQIKKINKFYTENPFAIYMPDRKELVDKRNERIGYGAVECKRCGERFVRMTNRNEKYCESCRRKYKHLTRREWQRDKSLTTGEIIALHNAEIYMESGEMEKIDLDTLRGIPSEQKDAIIKALFEALRAKKTAQIAEEAVKPKERKMTQKGMFFAEVDKLQAGEYISLFELIDRSGTSKNPYMKSMNVFRSLKEMPEGVLDILACKIGNFPSGWVEKNLYRKSTSGWKKHKKAKIVALEQ